ncbi:RNA-binding domain-containing protein [Aureobasidium pullulans]|nr:RNA-binding domain-containing protein [Aureobasidium pullulans]
MNQIKQVQRLNERELEKVVPSNASWHTDYRDTAYIYVGGLNLDLSEGDVITIFSQYGEPVWIRLMRDKETGKSRGFCWLKYEDQRSCDLAVDNLGGATVMGKMLAVDHTRYKKRDDEDEDEGYVGQDKQIAGAEAEDSETEEERRPLIKEELELAKLVRDMEDDDPMKAYMIEQKKEEVEKALKKASSSSSRKHDDSRREKRHHRSRRDHSGEDRHRRHRRGSLRDIEDDRRDRVDGHRSHRRRSNSPRRDRSESPRKDKYRSTKDRDDSPPRRERDSRRREYTRSPTPPTRDRDYKRKERRRSSTPPRRRDDSRSISPRPRR